MKKARYYILHMFGGMIIAMTLITFFGALFQAGMKLSEIFGWEKVAAFAIISYVIGWAFFRKLDKIVSANARPHMVHYHIDDIKNKRNDNE